jgi:hypothetical protein
MTKQTQPTPYNVNYSTESKEKLQDTLLDIFIRAYMKSVLDELYPQRDNICPQGSNKEDESNE